MPQKEFYRTGTWEMGIRRYAQDFLRPYLSNIRINHFYALYYCVSGAMSFQILRKPYTIRTGEILLISSAEPSVITAQAGDRYDIVRITFERDWLEALHMEELLLPFENRKQGENNLIHPSDFPNEYWLQAVGHFVRESAPDDLEAKVCTLSLLWCILEQFRSQPGQTGRVEKSLSEKILDHVNLTFLQETDIPAIAEKFHISRASLYRIFKEETGLPIGAYVTDKRLLAAKEMLISGVSPKNVSTYCRFKDYSTFYRAYKRRFGISPGQEKRMKNKPENA